MSEWLRQENLALRIVATEPPLATGQNADQATLLAEAVSQMEPPRKTIRDAVHAMLRARHFYGATDREIQDALKLPSVHERDARSALVDVGLVVKSCEKRINCTGYSATVWVMQGYALQSWRGAV